MTRRQVVSWQYSCDMCEAVIADGAGGRRRIHWAGQRCVVDLCDGHRDELDSLLVQLETFLAAASPGISASAVDPAGSGGPWFAAGARCRSAPAELFFPAAGDDPGPAKAVCSRCPVLEPCRRHALVTADLEGVWAAMTAEERDAERLRPRVAPSASPTAPSGPIASPGTLTRTLEELTASPGRWASVARWRSERTAGATAVAMRNGSRPVPGGGTWTFKGCPTGDGGSQLFAHFTPDDSAEVSARGSGPSAMGQP